MPPKRKSDDSESPEPPSARERKKQKTVQARTISVQSNPAGRNDNATAGPSRAVRFNSEHTSDQVVRRILNTRIGMEGLPASIDVERFAEVTDHVAPVL